MATLVNKMNREVKVIIPNMREFRVFFSDNEGSVMFFKRDWVEVRDEHWKPSEEQMNYLSAAVIEAQRRHNESTSGFPRYRVLKELYEQLLKL